MHTLPHPRADRTQTTDNIYVSRYPSLSMNLRDCLCAQYTFSISEACPTHRLSWTDEFTFNTIEHQYRDAGLPVISHLYPVTKKSITRRDADKDNGEAAIERFRHLCFFFRIVKCVSRFKPGLYLLRICDTMFFRSQYKRRIY